MPPLTHTCTCAYTCAPNLAHPQAWGTQNVAPALTPARWAALLAACNEGHAQDLFSPTEAAQLLGSLCTLSLTQVSALLLLSCVRVCCP